MTVTQLSEGSIFASQLRVVREIAASADSRVYEVVALQDGAQRCLKVLDPELVREPALRARFLEHLSAVASLSSPVIVAAQPAVEPGSGLPWLLMDFLRGENLETALRGRPLLPRDSTEVILTQVASGLAAAHARGIAHGNLKPHNVFLCEDPAGGALTARLLNLGLARAQVEARQGRGAALGTPMWMAPELASGASPRVSSDVWALGLLAYRLLTGRFYWREANQRSPSPMGILREVAVDRLVPASERAREQGCEALLPRGFDDFFARCVQRSEADRYPGAEPLLRDLADLWAGRPLAPLEPSPQPEALVGSLIEASPPQRAAPHRPRRRWLLLLPLLLVALALTVYWGWQTLRERRLSQRHVQCESQATSRAELLLRRDACLAECNSDRAAQCLLAGDLILQHRLDEGRSSEHAAEAYRRSCTLARRGCRQLGMLLLEGNGVRRDVPAAIAQLRVACEGQDELACAQLAETIADEGLPMANQDLTLRALSQACERDQVAGCTGAGRALRQRARPGDLERGLALLKRACGLHDAAGCTAAAAMLAAGLGGARDDAQAVALLRRACEGRDGAGCIDLGVALQAGRGAPRDLLEAARLFQRECESGGPEGCHRAAQLLLEGVGGPRDRRQGLLLLQRACQLGRRPACDELRQIEARDPPRVAVSPAPRPPHHDSPPLMDPRRLCLDGPECAPEPPRGPGERACGTAESCMQWGLLKRDGLAGPRDLARAAVLLREACMLGSGEGCAHLADLLLRGAGVRRNQQVAQELWRRACSLGYAPACGRGREPRDAPAGLTPVMAPMPPGLSAAPTAYRSE